MAFQMATFEGRKGGQKKMKKRGAMTEMCGCRLSSIKRRGGGTQPVIKCPGSPLPRIISKDDAAKYRGKGTFCADVLKPFYKR